MVTRSHPSKIRRNHASQSRINIARRGASSGQYITAISRLRKCGCYAPFALLMIRRSYWTWVILSALIVIVQLLGVGEKLWIKVGSYSLGIC